MHDKTSISLSTSEMLNKFYSTIIKKLVSASYMLCLMFKFVLIAKKYRSFECKCTHSF